MSTAAAPVYYAHLYVGSRRIDTVTAPTYEQLLTAARRAMAASGSRRATTHNATDAIGELTVH